MKHLLWTGICAAAILATGCSDDTGFSATGTGSLSLSLDVDRAVATAQQSRASLDEIVGTLSADDFTVRLTDEEGNVQEWPYTSFTGEHIRIGRYTVEAYCGTEGAEGFDKAYFIGSEQATVTTDNVTPVAITASLANSALRVAYTDAFRSYMTSYTASVRTAGSADGIDYPATVTDDDLFINAGDASLYVTFTTVAGQTATLKAAEFTAAPRHRYTVTVDVNGGEIGDAVLTVTFDDETVAETREFVLSDELLNAPAPRVTPAEQSFDVIEGNAPEGEAKVNIVAAGKLGAVTLTTGSAWLLAQGWPAEIDLLKATPEQQQLLTRLGLSTLGLWSNPDKIAMIDFAGVIANLGSDAADNTTTFRVEVEDLYGKVSDPAAVVNVTLSPLTLEVKGQDMCVAGATTATLRLAYNGNDLDRARFEVYHEASGVWDTVVPESITLDSRADSPVWNVVIPVPATVGPIQVRITVGSLPTVNYTISRDEPNFTISANPFATYAIVTIDSNDALPATILPNLKFTATEGSTPVSGLQAVKVSDSQVKVSGFHPGSQVTVKATFTNNEATTSFTTEQALAIPNGDFETLVDGPSVNNMNQSGKWSISSGINYQTTTSFAIKEPTGWATVNAKTASASANPQNSWFVVPSTVNTTLSWTSTVPKIKIIGTGGGTDTPPAVRGLTAQSGSNAMLLRNVGWDLNGSVPGTEVHTGGSDVYYCHPSANPANRSAGKLFLGTYSYSGGRETYNEGVNFSSRPASLSGFYKFERDAADPSETGMVTVKVLNGSTVIAETTLQLEPAADYTRFTVPLTYAPDAPVATSVRVMFASSNHASYNQADETAAIKTSDRKSRYECYTLGSALTVDNLSFNY